MSRKPVSKKQIEDQAIEDAREMSHKETIDELIRDGRISDMLQAIMSEHRAVILSCPPCPPSTDRTVSFGQLGEFPPTQVRNLIKCFAKDLHGWKSGASDRTLEKMLVEFGGGDAMACRQASPTILITKRDDYKRKVNGEYNQENVPCTIINSWAH